MCLTAARTDERVMGLVIAEIIGAERGRRNEAIRPRLIELHEKPGAGHAGNAALETRADLIDEMGRDEPLDRLTFCSHGAPFRRRYFRSDFGQIFGWDLRQPIGAEVKRGNE